MITPINERLHRHMLDNGYTLKKGNKYTHYIDSDGNYVSYPIGYITGPSRGTDALTGKPYWYCSVQGGNGWRQRSGTTPEEVSKWAIQKQKEVME